MKNQICGLNYLDIIITKGLQLSLESLGSTFPVTMGVEAAGIVEKIGDKVDGVAVGERVAYVVIGSGEYFMFTQLCTSHGNCTDRILNMAITYNISLQELKKMKALK